MATDPAVDAPLDVARIRRDLSARIVGRRIELVPEVGSTNAALRELAVAGAPEGTVFLADRQTAARGRGGKPWFSPPGVNLYASVLVRPDLHPAAVPTLAFATSLALVDAVRELGLPVAIKWPNDVLVRRRKVAGALAEAAIRDDRVEHAILGVGVNVNVTQAELRAALGESARAATSLAEALGQPVDRSALAAAYLGALDEWLLIQRAQGARPLLQAWRELDIVSGRRVEVRAPAGAIEGRALGVADDGHLRVATHDGRVHTVVTGEIRLLD
jgi:BirA family biotin operon repressor/biotin-[acetyl-CoA-carboxylase] ligase